MDRPITVMTVTRGRPDFVKRAIETIQGQDYGGEVQHLIVIDSCIRTLRFLEVSYGEADRISWTFRGRETGEHSGPHHLAEIRNFGAQLITTPWMAFLDDDNELDSNHYSLLMSHALATGAEAVHSWRKLFDADGAPYLEERWPWDRDPIHGQEKYREMVAGGYMELGSNILRDSVDIMTIDTNVWLIKTDIVLGNPISSEFDLEDWTAVQAEDGKMLQGFVNNGVRISCNGQATVRYYLGGYSNDFSDQPRRAEKWQFDPGKLSRS